MLREFEKKIAEFAETEGLFQSADRILLAVSGGADSTALLHAMWALKAEGVNVGDDSLAWPRAEMVHRIGRAMSNKGKFADPSTLTPIYLRRPEAEELWIKRHGT